MFQESIDRIPFRGFMAEHDDSNNEIYRLIKAGFEFTDDDLVEIWSEAGKFFSPSTVNSFARSVDNRRYKPLYPGPLKKWLGAVCERLEAEHRGFSIAAYTTGLCDKYNVLASGDPLTDAKSLRDYLRAER